MYQIHTYLTGNTLDMEQCERLTQYKSIITFVPNLSHNFQFTTPRHLEALLLFNVCGITKIEKDCFQLGLNLLIPP